jgi:hypothetical protein
MSAPTTVKKILCTRYPARIPGNVEPGTIARNMISMTSVPMFAGSTPFSATFVA